MSSKKDGKGPIPLYFCVRENGQFSFENCGDVHEDFSSYYYLKIISEDSRDDNNEDYLNKNTDMKYKINMKNRSDVDCRMKNKINIFSSNNLEHSSTDNKEFSNLSYSPYSRNALSSEELGTFYEEGYLKVPCVVDELRISACVR